MRAQVEDRFRVKKLGRDAKIAMLPAKCLTFASAISRPYMHRAKIKLDMSE